MVIDVFYWVVFVLPAAAILGYYLSFALIRLVGGFDRAERNNQPHTRFVILIPAHNEETTIAALLTSIQELNYPAELFRPIVVVDNSNDRTSSISQAHAMETWERTDPDNRGKGHAIAWALDRLTSSDFDVVLLVDADCRVRRNVLTVLDAFFSQEVRAVQLNHAVMNPDTSPLSFAAAVGRILEYEFLFAPKSYLGLSAMLVGTGMALKKDLLNQIPWQAESCTEDTEYTLTLAAERERVRFATEAYVECWSVESNLEMQVQRQRWASGNLSIGRSQAIKQLGRGIVSGNVVLADVCFALIVASKPLVLLHLLLTVLIGIVLVMLSTTHLATWGLTIAFILSAAYIFYYLLGVFWVGLNRRRLQHLARSPSVVIRLIMISLRAVLSRRESRWNQTPRG